MRLFYSLLVALCVLSSCSAKNSNVSHLRNTTYSKPSVALVPLINHTETELPWDISKEITLGTREYLLKKNSLYLSTPDETDSDLIGVQDINLLDDDLEMANRFHPNDFVVLMELIKHEELPYVRQAIKPVYPASGKIAYVLSMMIRIKVLDIRGDEPKVVLREIVRSNHLIPEALSQVHPEARPWGSVSYYHSPLGMSHRRLERDLAQRLETYISSAQNRS
ncbi:hypothetical protein SCG7109_AG_00230 [Chlamydiales bacterium SCGC AG-110-M15]|nr:hypothetical protein SCG7109_AG_00230 [Chlamydiales bacterium SCGC AG-110-M15]